MEQNAITALSVGKMTGERISLSFAPTAGPEWMVDDMRLKLLEYGTVRAELNKKYKETRQLIQGGETHLDNLAEGFLEADRVIWSMPTMDAVPVVRCKDCEFSHMDGWFCGGAGMMPEHATLPESFCDHGERKEGSDVEGDRGV